MAVLVEGISVVIRKEAIEKKMAGGRKRFDLLIPNATFCEDGQLARIGFLDSKDVKTFIDELCSFGLTYIENDQPVDMIVCDQQHGPAMQCEWIEFAHLSIEGGKVAAAWLWEGPRRIAGMHMPAKMQIAMPSGWQFKDSLSDKFHFVPDSALSERQDH